MSIEQNYKNVLTEIAQECDIAGRVPEDVLLLAVSKTVGLDGVQQAMDAGATDFGENRPEQLEEKAKAFPQVKWHFIGNIQSRQIKRIVKYSYLIHSLCVDRHAQRINDAAAELGKIQDVLLEVNVSGEESKSGVSPDLLPALTDFCSSLPNLRMRGLMTMAPRNDAECAAETFAGLRSLLEEIQSGMSDADAEIFDQLSMGMSDDWRIGIEEGSTIVRVGRAIFSDDFATERKMSRI